MKRIITYWVIVLFFGVLWGCASPGNNLVPPTVVLRDIANMERIAKGEVIEIAEHAELFLPEGCKIPEDGEVFLTVHFHAASWFAREEHARRGATNPLLTYSGMEGSSRYKKPFLDRDLFRRLLDLIVQEIAKKFDRKEIRIPEVEITSFSAGYGAVREILKSPEYVSMIRTVILADSMYAGFAEPGKGRTPNPEHIQSFVDFAPLAVRGEKTFVITCSSGVPATYASTWECAHALIKELGGEMTKVDPNAYPSAAPWLDYPLIERYDAGGLHVWIYGGDDPKAHMAQARTLADIWAVIEPYGRAD